HWTISLAQRGGDWMRVAVLQARKYRPPREVYFARRRHSELSHIGIAAGGDEAVAANGNRFHFRAIGPHGDDVAVVVDGVGGGLRRRTLDEESGGDECDADSGGED